LTLLALLALLLVATRAQLWDSNIWSEEAVIKFINEYGTDLNALAEYSLGETCSLSSVNTAALSAAATTFVAKYFSPKITSYLVVQQTAGFAPVTVLNASVGGAAQPAEGIPALPNSAALYNWLSAGYTGFFNYAFSRPFWWIIDKPYVSAFNIADPQYGFLPTAYLVASDTNEGFFCNGVGTASVSRVYRKQQSVYHHVLVLQNGAWKFLVFEETNKNFVTFNPLPAQVQPVN
jgi:hypothetical protein